MHLALLLPLLAPDARAQDPWPGYDTAVSDNVPQGLGLGLVIGDPTGFSGAWRKDRSTIDGALAWSIPDDRLHLHGDYLFSLYTFQDPLVPEVEFPLYLGVGGRFQLGVGDTTTTVGVRLPVGLAVVPSGLSLPLDAFLEIVPVVGVWPGTKLDFDAAIGVRVYPF